ncbi:hypothetical protein [Geomonas oryzae]|uniref:hypothetical protein n=1 Tax=Geomonas oryzae TaxID=2364273 RepID=UPI00100BF49C|nr:hypothetical protein [Geomonas oryzae]
MSEGKMNKKRVFAVTVIIATIFLLTFKYAFPQTDLLHVSTVLTGVALLVALLIELLLRTRGY